MLLKKIRTSSDQLSGLYTPSKLDLHAFFCSSTLFVTVSNKLFTKTLLPGADPGGWYLWFVELMGHGQASFKTVTPQILVMA